MLQKSEEGWDTGGKVSFKKGELSSKKGELYFKKGELYFKNSS